MRFSSSRILCLATAALLAGSSASAVAGSFVFTPSGQTSAYGWSGESPDFGHLGSDNQNMGSPSFDASGVHFQNAFGDMNYTVDGSTPNINSRDVMGLSTNGLTVFSTNIQGASGGPAPKITQIIVRESGTFVSDNPAADFSIVQTLGIQFFDPFAFPVVSNLPTPTFDLLNNTWQTELIIDVTTLMVPTSPFFQPGIVTPNGFDTVKFDLVNNISLTSGSADGASFTKVRADIFIPEPGTVFFFMFGAASAIMIKRRRTGSNGCGR